jgi:tRNA (cmo5U34)-methyltransferase
MPADVNLWRSPDHALEYLARVETIPHRNEGESALLDSLPRHLERVLDLGSGDGRILALIKQVHPHVCAVAVDFSDAMLERLRARFAGDGTVKVVAHDLDVALPDFGGSFDAVVSGFAIHHLAHPRKRSLYAEVFRLLTPGGVFCNLEHVASATEALHRQFLEKLGMTADAEDPSNKLLDVERNCPGYGRLASPTSTAIGNGGSSRCLREQSPDRLKPPTWHRYPLVDRRSRSRISQAITGRLLSCATRLAEMRSQRVYASVNTRDQRASSTLSASVRPSCSTRSLMASSRNQPLDEASQNIDSR